jgi:hypothetical protein
LSRTGSITQPLTIRYLLGGRAQSGVDYTPLDAQVTIPAGRRTTTLPIIPIDDLTVEGDEEVVVTLLDDAAYDLDPAGQSRSAAVTIVDDDNVPRVTIHRPERFAQEVGEVPGRFVIRRTGSTELPLRVQFTVGGSAAPGIDYTAISRQATLRVGRREVSIFIRPNNDAIFEGDETVRITLLEGPGFTLSQTNPGQVSTFVTIRDRPTVTISVADPAATAHPSDPAAFRITRTGPTSAALRVSYQLLGTARPGTDYVGPPALITIPAGQTSVLVLIKGRGTRLGEISKTVTMKLKPLAGYNLDFFDAGSQQRTVTIWDV